jgi:hypothetical protein
MRSINTRGRLVAERLAYGEAMVGEVEEMSDWIEDGYNILAELRAAIHGEIDPRSLEEGRVRHWQKYGRGFDHAALALGQPNIKDWLRANPEAPLDVAERA